MLDRFDSYRWAVVAVLMIPVIAGAFLYLQGRAGDEPAPLILADDPQSEVDIRVYVTGAVANPGVYSLGPDLRWIDALEAAGGPTDEADIEAVNLANRAKDEDMIVIPRLGQGVVSTGNGSSVSVVNINTATESELDTLPGIGEVRASRIVVSRQDDGPFTTIEDLLTRDLIPASVFEDMAPLIAVN